MKSGYESGYKTRLHDDITSSGAGLPAQLLFNVERNPRWTSTLGPYYDLPIDTFKKATPMEVVTVSSKFQVVIPLRVRESLGVKPGERMQVVQYGDRIELIPQRPARALRGLLRGIDTDVPRDADRT